MASFYQVRLQVLPPSHDRSVALHHVSGQIALAILLIQLWVARCECCALQRQAAGWRPVRPIEHYWAACLSLLSALLAAPPCCQQTPESKKEEFRMFLPRLNYFDWKTVEKS